MKIGIVIISYNSEEKLLKKVIENVIELENIAKIEKILIVDVNTKMNILSKVKKISPDKIKILKLNYDPGTQMMRALGSYYLIKNHSNINGILFVDNDVIIVPQTFSHLLNIFKNDKEIGIIAPITIYPDKKIQWTNNVADTTGFVLNHYITPELRYKEDTYYTSYANGAIFLIRPHVLRKIGFGRYEFPYWFDDVDTGIRTWIAGYKCLVVMKSIAIHMHGFTREKQINRTKLKWYSKAYIQGRLYFSGYNFGLKELLKTTIFTILDIFRFEIIKYRRDSKNKLLTIFKLFHLARLLPKIIADTIRYKRYKRVMHNNSLLNKLITIGYYFHVSFIINPNLGRRIKSIFSSKYLKLSK